MPAANVQRFADLDVDGSTEAPTMTREEAIADVQRRRLDDVLDTGPVAIDDQDTGMTLGELGDAARAALGIGAKPDNDLQAGVSEARSLLESNDVAVDAEQALREID
jgi:hypothetical protein